MWYAACVLSGALLTCFIQAIIAILVTRSADRSETEPGCPVNYRPAWCVLRVIASFVLPHGQWVCDRGGWRYWECEKCGWRQAAKRFNTPTEPVNSIWLEGGEFEDMVPSQDVHTSAPVPFLP